MRLATVLCLLLGVGTHVFAADDDRWCFRFTWLGPGWENATTQGNYTCSDLDQQQPCTGPLVITHDGTPPNTSLMWDIHEPTKIACKLSRSEVCIKWVNYYDGAVENITYMCGKMTDEDSGSITRGCESQSRGAYKTEVCACTDYLGIPCNSAPGRSPATLLAVLSLATIAISALIAREP